MISAALKNNAAKTVYRNNSDTHYTRIDNKTLRLKIPGDAKVSAYSILMYALSCQTDWVITVNSLSNFFDVPESTIRKKLTLLSKAGLAKSVAITHARSKKIIRHQWIFYESSPKPLHRITRSGKKDENAQPPKQNYQKNHCTKLSAVVPIIENKQPKEETTTATPPEPPPDKPPEPPEKQPKAIDADDILNLRKQLPPEINFRINNTDLSEHLGISDDHIKWAVGEALKPWVNNPIGMFRSKCRQEMPPSPPIPPKPKSTNKNFNDDKNDLTVKLHDIDFGKYEFEVKKCWLQIKELCKRSSIYFYARIDSQAAMQRGISAITILNALNNTIDNWDNVNDNPKAYFEAQCGMKWG